MLGIALLNEIVRLDESPKANEILNELRKRIKTSLHQESHRDSASDGMDISLCIIDLESKEVQYAGANSPMYIVSENNPEHLPKLVHVKPDRMPIGVYVKEHPFTNHVIKLATNDVIYLFSDGFQDQFGGKDLKKFKATRFKSLLEEIYPHTLNEQREILYETFETWRAGTRQLDDVLIIGVRILDNYGAIDFFD
jgi:serine phosphatase RsbU (regulator of sigma subunit)